MAEKGNTSITETATIAEELQALYRASDYRVEEADPPFVMHIDQPCPELRHFMSGHGAQQVLFISAWNPGSVERSPEENRTAQQELETRLQDQGYQFFRGVGEDPSGACPGEPCVLVLNWPEELVLELAREYGQNTVIWANGDGIPKLRLTR